MKDEFDQFTGFQWDEGNINKNLYKHKVENWECEQIYFNEPLIILDDPKHSILILAQQLQRFSRSILFGCFFAFAASFSFDINHF